MSERGGHIFEARSKGGDVTFTAGRERERERRERGERGERGQRGEREKKPLARLLASFTIHLCTCTHFFAWRGDGVVSTGGGKSDVTIIQPFIRRTLDQFGKSAFCASLLRTCVRKLKPTTFSPSSLEIVGIGR